MLYIVLYYISRGGAHTCFMSFSVQKMARLMLNNLGGCGELAGKVTRDRQGDEGGLVHTRYMTVTRC